MNTAKQSVTKLISQMPDNCSLDDIQYHLYVMQKIKHGLKDAHEGRIYSQDEMEKRFSK